MVVMSLECEVDYIQCLIVMDRSCRWGSKLPLRFVGKTESLFAARIETCQQARSNSSFPITNREIVLMGVEGVEDGCWNC